MALPKMGEKKKRGSEIYGRVKKKKKGVMSTIFLQHVHNKSHVISYYQLKKICDKLIVAMVWTKQGKKNCDKLIVAMALPKQGEKKNCENLIVAMPLPKQGNKKKFSNYGNGIAENGRKKKIIVAEIWGGIKKKMLRLQYFYNIFTTNLR